MKMSHWIYILLLFPCLVLANNKELNIYNWSDYLPDKVIQEFEHETGIKVNYTEYDNTAIVYAKLKSDPHAGYDIVVPESYYVDRMRRQGMLHKLDKSKLPNLKNLNPALLNKPFDPHNNYSIPYLWGTTGIVVNKKYIPPNTVTHWADFWDSKYKNQIMLHNDMRDTFGMAFLVLGYSVNDQNPKHIKQAYLKLKQLLPNVKLFNTDAAESIYIDEDATIGMGWNGDVYQAMRSNDNLKYIYPKDGFILWIDCMVIPKYAPHVNNAYKFINFLMRPDIAAQITTGVSYSSPNLAALKFLPKKIRDNQTINPSNSILKYAQFETAISDKARALYAKYWELLKIGG